MKHEHITSRIIGGAMKVHSALGPGLLESAYRACLIQELSTQGLNLQCEVPLSISYNGTQVDVGYRVDLLVEELIIVELKAVERIIPVHEAQLLSYLKLSKRPVGLLINFNVLHLRDGICRKVL
jgi:GxxExxY protein